MTRVAEQEIKDTIKKSDFKTAMWLIGSTASIVSTFILGGQGFVNQLKTNLKTELRSEVRSEVKIQLDSFRVEQAKRDNDQDAVMSGFSIKTVK
jgi:hypothetical protein